MVNVTIPPLAEDPVEDLQGPHFEKNWSSGFWPQPAALELLVT